MSRSIKKFHPIRAAANQTKSNDLIKKIRSLGNLAKPEMLETIRLMSINI